MAGGDYSGLGICPKKKTGTIEGFLRDKKNNFWSFHKGPDTNKTLKLIKMLRGDEEWVGLGLYSVEWEGDVWYILAGYTGHIDNERQYFIDTLNASGLNRAAKVADKYFKLIGKGHISFH